MDLLKLISNLAQPFLSRLDELDQFIGRLRGYLELNRVQAQQTRLRDAVDPALFAFICAHYGVKDVPLVVAEAELIKTKLQTSEECIPAIGRLHTIASVSELQFFIDQAARLLKPYSIRGSVLAKAVLPLIANERIRKLTTAFFDVNRFTLETFEKVLFEHLDRLERESHLLSISTTSSSSLSSSTLSSSPNSSMSSHQSSSTPNSSIPSRLFCKYCKKKGHSLDECRKKKAADEKKKEESQKGELKPSPVEPKSASAYARPYCTFCHKPGHSIERCWIQDPSRKPKNVSAIGVPEKSPSHVCVCVGDQSFEALVDSGASLSLIARRTLDKLGVFTARSHHQSFSLADGSLVSSDLEITISEMSIASEVYRDVNLAVLESIGPDMILGTDLLRFSFTRSKELGTNPASIASLDASPPTMVKNPFFVSPEDSGTDLDIDPFPNAAEVEKTTLPAEIKDFADVFSPVISPALVNQFSIRLKADAPHHCCAKAIVLSQEDQAFVSTEIKRLLEAGIIIPSKGDGFVSNIFVAHQRTKSRLVVNYRGLNEFTVDEVYPIPGIDEVLGKLKGYKVFAKFDQASGYHQIPVEPGSMRDLSFICADGLFTFKRVPFGVKNAPAFFNSEMSRILKELEHIPGAILVRFFDDFCVAAKDEETLWKMIRAVLELFRKYNIKLGLKKSVINVKSIEFLGYVIDGTHIGVIPSRLKAIDEIAAPTSKKALQRVLGFFNFSRHFIPDFAELCAPLSDLLKGGEETIQWTEIHDRSLLKLKEGLKGYTKLVYPDVNLKWILRTDASKKSIGAQLIQVRPDGTEETIIFLSRKLTPAETRYSTTDLECLAFVYTVSDQRHLLIAKEFVWQTDHRNLTFLSQSQNGRVQRWKSILSEFKFQVEYIRGSENVVTDFLSRSQPEEGTCESCCSILLDDLKKEIPLEELPESVSRCNSGLYVTKKWKIFVASLEMRQKIIEKSHDLHQSIASMIQMISCVYEWPGLTKDVVSFVESCPACQLVNAKESESPLLSQPSPSKPFDCLSIDFVGPLPLDGSFKYIFVAVDDFTRFTWLIPTKSASAAEAAQAILEIVGEIGIPSLIRSDNAFASELIGNLCSSLHVELQLVLPYSPQSNGIVERKNRSLLAALKRRLISAGEWVKELWAARLACNTHVNASNGRCPFQVLFGLEPRTALQIAVGEGRNFSYEEALDRFDSYRTIVKDAFDNKDIEILSRLNEMRGSPPYQVNDYVLMRSTTAHVPKLDAKWKGPFQVTSVSDVNPKVISLKDLVDESTIERVNSDRCCHFNASRMKLQDIIDLARKTQGEFIVESIVDEYVFKRKNYYLVHWKGYDNSFDTWESGSSLKNNDAYLAFKKGKNVRIIHD